jgi:hypothetical protein
MHGAAASKAGSAGRSGARSLLPPDLGRRITELERSVKRSVPKPARRARLSLRQAIARARGATSGDEIMTLVSADIASAADRCAAC